MSRRAFAILIIVVSFLMLAILGIVFITSQDQPQPTPLPVVTNEEGTPVTVEAADVTGTPPAEGVEGVEAGTPLPDMVEVVVSLQTVPRGWQITENEIAVDLRMASEVASNAITDVEDVIGLFARSDIYQGQTLTKEMLAEDPTLIGIEEYGPSSLIPPGFLAAGIPIDRLSSVGYAAAPGDYVDILITFYFYEIDEQFQSYLPNAGLIYLEQVTQETDEEAGTVTQEVREETFVIVPYGRFEELPTGDLAHITPSEHVRPLPLTMVLQNARVIQVGPWEPPGEVLAPTPIPTAPAETPEVTPTATVFQVTPTRPVPDAVVVALSPQQLLFLKYAVESTADIDLALRGVNDGQLYEIEGVDLTYLLERYNIEIPPNFNYTVDRVIVTVTAPPQSPEEGETTEEGG